MFSKNRKIKKNQTYNMLPFHLQFQMEKIQGAKYGKNSAILINIVGVRVVCSTNIGST